ncbi:arylsulfatase [Brachybacterium alimentarium]|uniref:arylsulfatase n=1 Tax=Brachybacterium alimentarium TaxID=47845 RepID=UPI000BB7347F|nr:arylsulfatase [Brachybacterium alimentarium]PCC32305.1 arylsulfatase [Brachybacterium alimentarium]RCS62417.1 arylsulfatase [Brachybacterium alimentarium]RCS78468.1 arylsulfatase [Brachybacterium alimentarium]RCS79716.1 arylsulfatase [Brachybacterium alimentarium]
MSRPNIILACVDEMRADAMGAAGNEHIDTQNLDDLAGGGYRFTRAYSATPTCVPARVAMFTGQSPDRHGRYGYREGISFPDAHPVTLQSTLRGAGYQAFGIGKMHVFPDRARCGFDEVLLHDGFLHISRRLTQGPSAQIDDYVDFLRRETGDPRADYQETGIGCNAMTARPWEREERLHPTRWVADESFRFLERRDPTRPFFLYMSFHRPHAPFDPPAWLWDKYRGREFPPRPMGDWVERFDEHRRDFSSEAEFGAQKESTHQQVRAGYYGSIEFVDLQLNRLREKLSDHGLLEDTVVVFVSDHGDMMGDHDMYRKSVGYEGSARIPLVMHVPPRWREGWGAPGEVSAIAELRDLMPTLLGLAGVEVPGSVDGLDLRPTTAGGTGREHLHGEHLIGSLGRHSMQWIRSQRFKYLWFSGDGHEQLFDLETDPHELHDLADDPGAADELARHREILVQELEGREEGFVHDGHLVAGRTPQSEASWVREHARL